MPEQASLLERKDPMNTGIRRFILRLAVGLLAFLIGVATVWALGGFNPFQSFSGTRQYKHKRCGSHRSWKATPETAVIYPLYLKEEEARLKALERYRESLQEAQRPHADAPMPPNPPRPLR
jgi:hypothetical protein